MKRKIVFVFAITLISLTTAFFITGCGKTETPTDIETPTIITTTTISEQQKFEKDFNGLTREDKIKQCNNIKSLSKEKIDFITKWLIGDYTMNFEEIKKQENSNENKITQLNELKEKIATEATPLDCSSVVKLINEYIVQITPTTTKKVEEKLNYEQDKEESNNKNSNNNNSDDKDNYSEESNDDGYDDDESYSNNQSSSGDSSHNGPVGDWHGYVSADGSSESIIDSRGDAYIRYKEGNGWGEWIYEGNREDTREICGDLMFGD